MTDLTDEYHQKCRQMADRVASPVDKEMWLQLAADWSVMASVRERFGNRKYWAPQLRAGPLMQGSLNCF
jgi:hypothetical protein